MYSLAPRQGPAGCTARKSAKGDAGTSFEHSDTAGRQPGLVPPMYRRPHCGLLPRQSRGHGALGAGGVRLHAASGSDHVVPATFSSPSLLRSHGAGRAGLSNTWTGS